MNRHRKTIERTYKDNCTINRLENYKDKYNKTKQREIEVCKDKKCKLIFSSLQTPKKNNNANEQTLSPKLLINPEIVILSADRITVTAKGRTYTFTAGLPGVYESHQEVPLEYKEIS